MTGLALGCIFVSGVLGAIFTPDMVTGYYHEHLPIAALTGWIFDLVGAGILLKTALWGIRAGVDDPAPWATLGLGVGAIWLIKMAVSICAPLSVFGTDPDRIPVFAGLGAIAGVIVAAILCDFVKVAAFEPAAARLGAATAPLAGLESPDDPAVKLHRLAQLRDSGTITEAEFQAKKSDLLSRV